MHNGKALSTTVQAAVAAYVVAPTHEVVIDPIWHCHTGRCAWFRTRLEMHLLKVLSGSSLQQLLACISASQSRQTRTPLSPRE